MQRLVALLTLATSALLGLTQNALAADTSGKEQSKPITVFAASSLTESLQIIADDFTKTTGTPVRLSFAASSALARQIEAGAHADVFFSADIDWVDYLQARNLLDSSTRRNVLSNRLVLITAKDNSLQLKIAPNFPLATTLGKERLATGDPDSVPVGRYARSALTSLGVWNVGRGEAMLGIVYATDAQVDSKVRVIDTFPSDSHLPIVYPIALTRDAVPQAKAFATYVSGKEAQAVFEKFGFTILNAQ
jgi:molybdate transport system substrate-binding protein